MKAYTEEPGAVPPPLRHRLETEWRAQTSNGVAVLGHAPQGYIYTPHGPSTPNEVLIELFTSDLPGWIWGDCYSLVLIIERASLHEGDFSNIMFEITN